jgi:D-3-phosphoglycerate dehydrogenase
MELLRKRGIQPLMTPPYTDAEEIAGLAAREQVDALLVRMGDINEAVIAASERLRVIAKHGVGVNNIDIGAASRHRVPVMITRAANARAVAEHALALLLAIMKNLRPLDAGVREGKWEKTVFKGIEVSGKCLGVVGFGSIGRDLATLLDPLGMRVLVFDPFLGERDLPAGVQRVERLGELLREADVVSLHCPLTDQTRGLIGRAELAAMKPTAYLINTARGEVVDEAALVETLSNGRIAGAGLDSFADEPPATDNPLWALPNVIVTPHIAGVTSESLRRMGVQAVTNILSVLDGRDVDVSCVVNPEVLG